MRNLNTLVLSHNDIGSLGKSLHGMPDLSKVTSPSHRSRCIRCVLMAEGACPSALAGHVVVATRPFNPSAVGLR
jgi:hypothetical protein